MSRSNHKTDCKAKEVAHPSIVPVGTPDWITPELVDATIRVWQPYYTDLLSPEEAVTMILSVGRLYQVFSSGTPP